MTGQQVFPVSGGLLRPGMPLNTQDAPYPMAKNTCWHSPCPEQVPRECFQLPKVEKSLVEEEGPDSTAKGMGARELL